MKYCRLFHHFLFSFTKFLGLHWDLKSIFLYLKLSFDNELYYVNKRRTSFRQCRNSQERTQKEDRNHVRVIPPTPCQVLIKLINLTQSKFQIHIIPLSVRFDISQCNKRLCPTYSYVRTFVSGRMCCLTVILITV